MKEVISTELWTGSRAGWQSKVRNNLEKKKKNALLSKLTHKEKQWLAVRSSHLWRTKRSASSLDVSQLDVKKRNRNLFTNWVSMVTTIEGLLSKSRDNNSFWACPYLYNTAMRTEWKSPRGRVYKEWLTMELPSLGSWRACLVLKWS